MPYVARLPEKSFWSRQFPDSWLLAAIALITLLSLTAFSIKLGLLVASLDQEISQIYPMQRDIRSLKDDVHAHRLLTDSQNKELGQRLKDLTTLKNGEHIQLEPLN
jgi:hypothetical protein